MPGSNILKPASSDEKQATSDFILDTVKLIHCISDETGVNSKFRIPSRSLGYLLQFSHEYTHKRNVVESAKHTIADILVSEGITKIIGGPASVAMETYLVYGRYVAPYGVKVLDAHLQWFNSPDFKEKLIRDFGSVQGQLLFNSAYRDIESRRDSLKATQEICEDIDAALGWTSALIKKGIDKLHQAILPSLKHDKSLLNQNTASDVKPAKDSSDAVSVYQPTFLSPLSRAQFLESSLTSSIPKFNNADELYRYVQSTVSSVKNKKEKEDFIAPESIIAPVEQPRNLGSIQHHTRVTTNSNGEFSISLTITKEGGKALEFSFPDEVGFEFSVRGLLDNPSHWFKGAKLGLYEFLTMKTEGDENTALAKFNKAVDAVKASENAQTKAMESTNEFFKKFNMALSGSDDARVKAAYDALIKQIDNNDISNELVNKDKKYEKLKRKTDKAKVEPEPEIINYCNSILSDGGPKKKCQAQNEQMKSMTIASYQLYFDLSDFDQERTKTQASLEKLDDAWKKKSIKELTIEDLNHIHELAKIASVPLSETIKLYKEILNSPSLDEESKEIIKHHNQALIDGLESELIGQNDKLGLIDLTCAGGYFEKLITYLQQPENSKTFEEVTVLLKETPKIADDNIRHLVMHNLIKDFSDCKDNSEVLTLVDLAIHEMDKTRDDGSYLSDLLFSRCALVSEVGEHSAKINERTKTLFQDNPEKMGLLLLHEGRVTGSSKTLSEAYEYLKQSTTFQGLNGLEACCFTLNEQISSEIARREALCTDDLGELLNERQTREAEKIPAYLRVQKNIQKNLGEFQKRFSESAEEKKDADVKIEESLNEMSGNVGAGLRGVVERIKHDEISKRTQNLDNTKLWVDFSQFGVDAIFDFLVKMDFKAKKTDGQFRKSLAKGTTLAKSAEGEFVQHGISQAMSVCSSYLQSSIDEIGKLVDDDSIINQFVNANIVVIDDLKDRLEKNPAFVPSENPLSHYHTAYLLGRCLEVGVNYVARKVSEKYIVHINALEESIKKETDPAKKKELEAKIEVLEEKINAIKGQVGLYSKGLDIIASAENAISVYNLFYDYGLGTNMINVPTAILQMVTRTPILKSVLLSERTKGQMSSTNPAKLYLGHLAKGMGDNAINKYGAVPGKILLSMTNKIFARIGCDTGFSFVQSFIPVISYLQIILLGYEGYKALTDTLPREQAKNMFHNAKELIENDHISSSILFSRVKKEITNHKYFDRDVELRIIYMQALYLEYAVEDSFSIGETEKDGNCLFGAIKHYVDKSPDQLRAMAGNYISTHKDKFKVVSSLIYIEGDINAYLEKMQKNGEWGSYSEIYALQHVLKRPIIVFYPGEKNPIFPYDNQLIDSDDEQDKVSDSDKNKVKVSDDVLFGDPIFLFLSGDHYSALLVEHEEYLIFHTASILQKETYKNDKEYQKLKRAFKLLDDNEKTRRQENENSQKRREEWESKKQSLPPEVQIDQIPRRIEDMSLEEKISKKRELDAQLALRGVHYSDAAAVIEFSSVLSGTRTAQEEPMNKSTSNFYCTIQ